MEFNVLLLGFIQGITEFLPVSSSGHLALAKIFLGINMPPLSYDLVLHVSTAFATIIFFFSDIVDLLIGWSSGFISANSRRSDGWTFGWAVILGTVITGIIGILLKNFAEAVSQNSLMVAIGLIITGIVLLFSRFLKIGFARVRISDGLFVGVAQAVAVLPGVSRSCMTIMSGLSIGLSREEAFRFSFILSIPAILGATLLQTFELGGWSNFVSTLPTQWYLGAIVAFFSGIISLIILKKIILSSKWWIFGIYCLALGSYVAFVTYLGV